MQESFRANESYFTAEERAAQEVFTYTNMQPAQDSAPRKDGNDLLKPTTTVRKRRGVTKTISNAFLVVASATLITVAAATIPFETVRLFAQNGNELTFLVDFDEENGKIEYLLTDEEGEEFYPTYGEEWHEEFIDEEQSVQKRNRYITFSGLQPDTMYTLTVTDWAQEGKVLYRGTFFTAKETIYVSIWGFMEHGMVQAEVFVEHIDSIYTVIIEDSQGNRIFADDYTESCMITIEHVSNSNTPLNMYVRYKNNIIAQFSLVEEGHEEKPYFEASGDLFDGLLTIDYYMYGYENLMLAVRGENNEVVYETGLSAGEHTITVDELYEQSYTVTVTQESWIIYSFTVEPRLPQDKPFFEAYGDLLDGLMTITYSMSGYDALTLYVRGQGNATVFETRLPEDASPIYVEELMEDSYTVVVMQGSTTIYTSAVEAEWTPIFEASADLLDGLLTVSYYKFHYDNLTLYVRNANGQTVHQTTLANEEGSVEVEELMEDSYTVVVMQGNTTV
ncbi:MAG: hypothetical protein J6Y65_02740, partial [Eggerthellaceae bacterium]|nr:hypothetical protein [Eggerthellaceae bacterium]